MSKLLEIFGRAIVFDTADLIWHWFDATKRLNNDEESSQREKLEKIVELIGDMKFTSADEHLKVYLSDNPMCVRGRLASALIRLYNNQIDEAISEFQGVYRCQPNNTIALYGLGHCYERLGNEDEAKAFYQDCLKFKNYLEFPRQRLAAIYFKNGQLEKTIREYQLLQEEYPDDISTLITLGVLYIANAEYNKAIETFNTAILIHPDNFQPDSDDISQLIIEGQFHQAMEEVDLLLEEYPERADLMLKRADILNAMEMADEAIRQYEQTLQIRPDFLEATIKLGTQYLQIGEKQLAAKQFNKAVELNDQIVEAYLGFVTASKLTGNISEALTTLSLAAAIEANSTLLFAEMSCLQFKVMFGENSMSENTGQSNLLLETVIEAHRQHILDDHNNPDLYYRLGILMMGLNKTQEAVELFKKALRINPTFRKAKIKLSICLFETNQKQIALEQLTKDEILNAETLQLYYKISLLYCDKIKFASSILNLERSLSDSFTNSNNTTNISVALQNLGLLDRATTTWDNLSQTFNHAMSKI